MKQKTFFWILLVAVFGALLYAQTYIMDILEMMGFMPISTVSQYLNALDEVLLGYEDSAWAVKVWKKT